MEIQLSAIIIQMINFGIIVFVIAKFIYKPILKILKQRTERIEQGQLEAEKIANTSQELESKTRNQILDAKKEANKIITDAKKEAEKAAAQIIAKAKSEAKLSAGTERAALLASVESEKRSILTNLTQLVTTTTAQVLDGALTETDQRKIIQSQLKVIKGASLE